MATNSLAKRERVAGKVINLDTSSVPMYQIADERAEEALIGAVYQQPDLFISLREIVQPADFFTLLRGFIWHAFDTLVNQNKGIDLVTVADELERQNCPLKGEDLIREMARMIERAPDTRNAEQYARAVFEASLRLRLLKATHEIHQMTTDKTISVDELIDFSDREIYKATNRQAESRTDALSIMGAYFDKVQEAIVSGMPSPGVQTGFPALDELMGGLYPGEVTVLAGGEGMGKTTCAMSSIRHVVAQGKRVALFTLEMTQEEIIRTFTAMETGIYKSVLKQFSLSDFQWRLFTEAAGKIGKWPLEIIDEFPTLSPVQCRRKLRKLVQTGNVDLVVIDGLWLMESSEPAKNDRPRDVFAIMRDLNQLARDFNLPILITHQYNAEIKNAKYPVLHHLSESAGVRRNAQVVYGLHRPSYYDRDSLDDTTDLYILKDRNGTAQGQKVPLIYNTNYSRYEGGQYVNVRTDV